MRSPRGARSARVVALLDQRLRSLEVVGVVDPKLEVAGAEMADPAHIAREALFEVDVVGVADASLAEFEDARLKCERPDQPAPLRTRIPGRRQMHH